MPEEEEGVPEPEQAEVTTQKEGDEVPPKKEVEDPAPSWTIWSAGSYAVVMLLVGLPLWWKTTAVQRVSLPYDDMASLRGQLQFSFEIKVPVNLIGFSKLSPNEQIKFDYLEENSFSVSYSSASPEQMDAIYKTEDLYATDKIMCKRDAEEAKVNGINSINVYYVGRADLLKQYGQRVILGNCRSFYYISNSAKVRFDAIWPVFRKITGVAKKTRALTVAGLATTNTPSDDALQLPLSAGYNILLSLLVPEPEVLEARWEIEKAVNDYLQPMLNKLKSFSDFVVRSQVMHYVRLNIEPKFNAVEKQYEVPYVQLPLLINPMESKLSSFVSENPALNFLTYNTLCSTSPLRILEKDGKPLSTNAFIVPQWGGIFLYNPPSCHSPDENATDTSRIHYVSTEQVMSVVISQLRSLIGLPEETSDDTLDFRTSAIRDWEVDMIARKRIKRLVFTAANTLHSLGQLLDEITNIVVTDEVGNQVEKSVATLKSAVQEASEGRLRSAQNHAVEAFKSSEIAFHHPKNLKQLYFPDDQKYAIYIPLFLPIGIPVLLSLRTILSFVMARRKAQLEKVKSD